MHALLHWAHLNAYRAGVLAYWLAAVCGALGGLGCLGALVAFFARFRPVAATEAPLPWATLALIVPIKGADAHTEDHLTRLVTSDTPLATEYLIAMESEDDPAFAIAQRVAATHPDQRVRTLVTGPAYGKLGKQHNLAVAVAHTPAEVIGSMDADIAVAADIVVPLLRALAQRNVGVAYCLPCYVGGGPLGGALVALYTNYSISPNLGALALSGNQPFTIGSLWLIARATLERIGGLEQFGDTVSDDAAIGAAVARAGLRNVLAGRTVAIPFEPLDLAGGMRHLSKWVALLRAEGLGTYLLALLTWHPMLWSTLALVAGLGLRARYPALAGLALALLTVAVAARVGGGLVLDRVFYQRRGWLPLALIPYELLIVPVLFGAGFVRRSIVWRGRRYWIGAHGAIRRSQAVG
ncbi:MAG TPA: glycosyltransferase [Ktedonobacterales bacterium]|nr:glycosyltransferase [Ktedonobacterales bacterium]